jgi:diguanylate cyclase (GGDEF)-like protein/PAS domain S-box-containing protein
MTPMPGSLLHLPRLVATLALTIWSALVIADEPVVRVGILGFRPVAEEQVRWQPLIDHLNAKVPGYRFRSEVLGYNDLEGAISGRTVEFVLTNPGHYVLMTHRNGMSSPLATLMPIEQGKAMSSFGGVVFTRADRSDLSRLGDLKGKNVAATSRGSLGGYQAQALTLLKIGVRVPQDVRLIETDMPHDKVVTAVLDGRADGGFVRTGVLEAMAREGKLELAQIKVLEPQHVDDFPFLVSTALYPEWPFAAMPGVDQDLARRVAAALLGLPHGGDLAQRMEIRGFNIPSDYEPVRATLEALRLPPFDVIPEFTPIDIWHKYRWQAMIGMVLTLVIVTLTAWLVALNRRLAYDQRQLDSQAQEWQGLLTALGDGVYGVGSDRTCTFINPAALAMLGRSSNEVLGRNPHDLFHSHHADGSAYPIEECPVFRTLTDGETRRVEDWFTHKDGRMFPVTVTATPVRERDGHQGMVVVFRDISDRLRLETALREEAATDALTQLPNRRYFLAEMERHRARIARSEERSAAVMMLDLDEFKCVNDTHGHEAGDEVLKHLATLMRDILRRGDLVGRLGGEEFAVLQVDATEEEALQLAERMRLRVEMSPVPLGALVLSYTLSIGATLMVQPDRSVRAPLQRADAALYRAKRKGRNRAEWETPPTAGPQ